MIRHLRTFALVFLALCFLIRAEAQSPASSPGSESSELLNLSKKIDEQNLKIDLLSQQILKLQQELEHPRALSVDHASATAASTPLPADANTHVVARGETLTSIARLHKVTIDELQKLNHIEDATKLRAGQTLVIPGASPAAASPSPSTSPPNE